MVTDKFRYSETVAGLYIIIGEKHGDILIYSKKHYKSYRFKGADVTACTQIKVKNDVLY